MRDYRKTFYDRRTLYNRRIFYDPRTFTRMVTEALTEIKVFRKY